MRHLTSSGFKQLIKNHRRLVIILALVGLSLVVIGSYTLWSVSAWQSYDRRIEQSLGSIHDKLDKALKLEVKDDQGYATKLTALEAIKTEVEQFKKDCQPASLLMWQTSLEGTKKLKDKCDQAASSLGRLQKDLDRLVAYLRDENRVAEILKPLSGTSEADETRWQETRDAWQGTVRKLNEIKVGNDFKSTYGTVRERLTGVVATWDELLAAHTAKDRARFEKAADELMKAYGTLKAVPDDTAGAFKELEDSLAKTYKAAF